MTKVVGGGGAVVPCAMADAMLVMRRDRKVAWKVFIAVVIIGMCRATTFRLIYTSLRPVTVLVLAHCTGSAATQYYGVTQAVVVPDLIAGFGGHRQTRELPVQDTTALRLKPTE